MCGGGASYGVRQKNMPGRRDPMGGGKRVKARTHVEKKTDPEPGGKQPEGGC